MTLDEYLKFKGEKEERFARLVGSSQPVVNMWRHGKRRPRLETMILIEEITDGLVQPKDFARRPQPV